jgi:hypothetical protein
LLARIGAARRLANSLGLEGFSPKMKAGVFIAAVATAFLTLSDTNAQGLGQNCVPAPPFSGASDEVRLTTPAPISTTNVGFELIGFRGNSPIQIYGVTYSVVGSGIAINARMNDQIGFSVPGTYCYRFALGVLPAGTYSVTYAIESSVGTGGFLPPRIAATSSVVVLTAPPDQAIPALGPLGITFLVAFIALMAASRGLTRRSTGRADTRFLAGAHRRGPPVS